MMQIYLLGHFRALWQDKPLHIPSGGKLAGLWAYLLLNQESAVPRDRLAATLWPDLEPTAGRTRLRRSLHDLRAALPHGEWIEATDETLRWQPMSEVWLDVAEFSQLAANPATLADAVALYSDDLMTDHDAEWLLSERERWRNQYLNALEQLVAQSRASHELAAAVSHARRLLSIEPLHERGLRLLLAARYESGDRAGALADYARFAELLNQQLGVEPMPETVSLYEAILHQRSLPGSQAATLKQVANDDGGQMARALPLVGRAQELTVLAQQWRRAASGEGGLVLVSGVAGAGKSRLVTELARRVSAEGGRVLYGAVSPNEPLPYQPFVLALRDNLPLLAASAADPAALSTLLPLLPELQARRPDLRAIAPLDAEREQGRLHRAVRHCLAALVHPHPLLLILEDLHWAGQATASLLAEVAREALGQPLLVVATYREEDVERSHPLRAVRRQLQAAQELTQIALGPLDRSAVGEVVAQLLPVLAQSGNLDEELYRRSEGNALFLYELVRDLLTKGLAALPSRLPDGIRSLVVERLQRLSANARLLAEVAAVIGTSFSAELLGEVVGLREGQTLDTLGELLDTGLLREDSAANYSFSHQLIGEVVYQELPPEVRRRRHRRSGQVLLDLYPEREQQSVAELARHFHLGGEPQLAATYYLRTAQQAISVYANDESIAAAELGLSQSQDPALSFDLLALMERIYRRQNRQAEQWDALERMAELAEELADDERRAEHLRRLAEYYSLSGENEAHATTVAALRDVAARLADPHWQAIALQVEAQFYFITSRYPLAVPLLTAAVARYAALGESAAQVDCYNMLSQCALHQGQFDSARQFSDEARRLAGDEPSAILARALDASFHIALEQSDFATACDLGATMLTIYQRIGDLEGEAKAHAQRAAPCAAALRLAEAEAHFAAARKLYASLNRRRSEASVLLNSGIMLTDYDGRYAEGMAQIEQADAIFAEAGNLSGRVHCAYVLAACANIHGDWSAAVAAAQRGLALAGDTAMPRIVANLHFGLGLASRGSGELATAIAELEAGLALYRELKLDDEAAISLAELALTHLQAGDLVAAEAAYAEASSHHIAGPAPSPMEDTPQLLAWTAALLHRVKGDAEAERELRKALVEMIDHIITFPEPTMATTYRQQPLNQAIFAAVQGNWPAWANPPADANIVCPTCGQASGVIRAGSNSSGTQRLRCTHCRRYFTLNPRGGVYNTDLREQAIRLRQQGHSLRTIARQLGVNHQSVANWLAVD